MADVSVSLLDATGEPVQNEQAQPLTVLTSPDGSYLFENLPPGSSQVVVPRSTARTDDFNEQLYASNTSGPLYLFSGGTLAPDESAKTSVQIGPDAENKDFGFALQTPS